MVVLEVTSGAGGVVGGGVGGGLGGSPRGLGCLFQGSYIWVLKGRYVALGVQTKNLSDGILKPDQPAPVRSEIKFVLIAHRNCI